MTSNKACKCPMSATGNRGVYPQCKEDERDNMKMKSVTTKNGFFRVCLLCDKPVYLREGKGP